MTKKPLRTSKNSALLKELQRRISQQVIRFTYDSLREPQAISGLISWDATDEYTLDFTDLAAGEAKRQNNWAKKFDQTN